MSEALKPCPFCGNADPTLEDHRLLWVVTCACGASVLGERAEEPTGAETTEFWQAIKHSAVERWNKRA
jgi:hypothetical protein